MITDRIRGATAQMRKAVVRDLVDRELRTILKLDAGARIDPAQPFRDLGLTSLLGVELAAKLGASLSAALGRSIEPTVLFDHPTVEKLIAHLVGEDAPARAITAVQTADDEPIAIIGIGCRFPGANGPDAYWRLLSEGRDAVGEVPADRWDSHTTDAEPATRFGGFLGQLDKLDAGFFGISPREAKSLDPQQRLLLEVSWEALEHAGIAADRLAGSDTGVFVGLWSTDYASRALAAEVLDSYSVTGNMASVAAGRIAYTLGLEGPCVSVDTACSSSLVSVNLACKSLRSGESSIALAGGVNLVLEPAVSLSLAKLRALSPSGRCKTFSAEGDGYVRSDGCGVLVLKPLSKALADGDRIFALIRGAAINQDGRSSGLTAPNGTAQEAVIKRALAEAHLAAADIDYVEAHGTGTPLGDPIEVQALARALCAGRSKDAPLRIGSAKTNIGHTEGAAGVAGLIKVVLALHHEELPPNLHFENPNPFIPWSKLPIAVVTERLAWPRGARPRRAGVSSFGMSGTNAHLIVEEAPLASRPRNNVAIERPLHLLPLSAKSEKTLQQQAAQIAARIEAGTSVADLCFSAATGRVSFEHRLAIVAGTAEKLSADLQAFSRGETQISGRAAEGKIAFLYTGQGAQYDGMGRVLFETQPVFRAALERCAALLRPHMKRPLLEVLYPAQDERSPIDETEFTQPALFALEVALTELWRSWGVVPEAVIGHSVGEFAAAHAAGVFSLEDAAQLIAARGRLMQLLPAGGSMLAVRASEDQVRSAIRSFGAPISIAAVNSPTQTVVSGLTSDLNAFAAQLTGIETRALPVSHAFHSPLMEPMLDDFRKVARRVSYSAPKIPLFSNADGRASDDIASADYWVRHVLAPVEFARGIRGLAASGVSAFVEIGPRPTLLAQLEACLPGTQALRLLSLRKDHDDWATILRSVARLFTHGATIDWRGFDAPYSERQRVALPTYPFERQRYWIDAKTATATAAAPDGSTPLAGAPLHLPSRGIHHLLKVGVSQQPYLADHRVHGEVVVPGAFYLAVLLAVARARLCGPSFVLRNIEFVRALVLETQTVELHVILSQSDQGGYNFELCTPAKSGRWQTHATGTLEVLPGADRRNNLSASCPRSLGAKWLLDRFENHRVFWGPRWVWTRELHLGDDQALSKLELPPGEVATADPVPPALLDNAIGTEIALLFDQEAAGEPYVPFCIDELRFYAPAQSGVWCHGRARRSENSGAADLTIFDGDGVCIEINGLLMKRAPEELFLHRGRAPEACALVLSASSEQELEQAARRFADHLAADPRLSLPDLCASAVGPSLTHRLVVQAEEPEQMRQKLASFAKGSRSDVSSGVADPGKKIAFLYTGQGAQYAGMGRQLFAAHPIYRRAIERCSQILERQLPRPLIDILYLAPREEDLRSTALMQPAIFSIEHALTEVWRSWGVEPSFVLGHSLGEYAAATAAGAFDLEQALLVTAARGRLLENLPDLGAAISVRAGVEQVAPIVERYSSLAAIAAINGPERLLVTGTKAATNEIARELSALGIEAKLLSGTGAGHSPLMDPILDALELESSKLRFSGLKIPLISTVTGRREPEELKRREHWRRHIREPVQFLAGMRALQAEGCEIFVEIGPRHTLLGLGQACLPEHGVWLSSLSKERDDWLQIQESLAELWTRGASVDWKAFHRPFHRRRVALPVDAARLQKKPVLAPQNLLLGQRLRSPLRALQFESTIEADQDFRLFETPLVPPGAHVARALLALAELPQKNAQLMLEDLRFQRPLVVMEPRTSQLILEPSSNGRWSCRISSVDGSQWQEHFAATIGPGNDARSPASSFDHGENEALAELAALEPSAVIEACFSVAARVVSPAEPLLPVRARSLEIFAPLEASYCYARARDGVVDVELWDAQKQLIGRINGLELERVTKERILRSVPRDLTRSLYQLRWQPADHEAIEATDRSGAYLIFGDRGGVANGLIEQLELLGERSILAQSAGDLDKLLAGDALRAIVDLRALDLPAGLDFSIEDLAAGPGRLLELVQTCSLARLPRPPRIWAVTRGAQSIDRPITPAAATSWGLGQVIALEHPELWGGLIDLDPAELDLALLAEEIWRDGPEPSVAFRGGRRLIARLEPASIAGTTSLQENATYLISGGLGALGLVIAKWLAANGAANIVLLGRRAPSEKAAQTIGEIEGARVHVMSLDISDEAQVEQLFADLSRTLPPIRGIVHAAGVLEDGMLAQQDWPRFSRVFEAKIRGAQLLDRFSSRLELDFFVLFSSLSGVIGNPGQGSYAAANLFLDSLAADRRARGLVATSIDWCPWAQGGMAAGLEDAFFRRFGVLAIEPEEGAELFGKLLHHPSSAVVVMPMSWPQFEKSFPKAPPRFAELRRSKEPQTRAAKNAPAGKEQIPALIQNIVANIIGFESSAALDVDRRLEELGFDSLLVTDLVRALQNALGMTLPSTLTFDHPTTRRITQYVLGEIEGAS